MRRSLIATLFLVFGLVYFLQAQTTSPSSIPPPTQSTTQPVAPAAPAARIIPPAYPVRPPEDPAMVARGKQSFAVNCAFCHGSDARGGETGPNLVRSQLVLDDQHGETIGQVILNGRIDKGMPKFDFNATQISDIAAFLHSLPSATRGSPPSEPINILVGDAKAGEAYFNGVGKCSTCHSVTGDLAGIGAKHDPKTLQNLLVSGGGGRTFGGSPGAESHVPPTTVTVTFATGKTYQGVLIHLDAFVVALTTADGNYHSFSIHGPVPKVVVHNALQPHIDMLATFKDTDIHNLTAYLVTIR